MIRRLIAFSPLPLAVLATALSGSMWLRAFPAGTLAVPLFGAAAVSVLVSTAAVRLSRRSMLWTAPAGLLGFLLYTLLVVQRSPLDLAGVISGFVDGPARLLSFALPLVSPRSLMVWPVALCWLAGLLAGESLARSRLTLLPYAGWLVVFGAGYAGSSRAIGADAASARRVDLAVAGALLLVLCLLRVLQGWTQAEASAEAAEATGAQGQDAFPLQRILAGAGVAAVAVLLAGYLAGGSLLAGQPSQLKRQPGLITADPTTPLAYVASLRSPDHQSAGTPLFDVSVDRPVPGYLPIASVDYYDGDSWSFDRSFRPSGGVLPADPDPDLAPSFTPVSQQYRIRSALLAGTPWMPAITRAQKVTGLAVSVDPVSAMIVPTGQLSLDQRYQVRSVASSQTLTELPASWLPATSAPPLDEQLSGQLRASLTGVLAGFAAETGLSSTSPSSFLQAVAEDLHANYLLAQAPRAGAGVGTPSPQPGRSGSAGAVPTGGAGTAIGGSSLSAVLAAVLGPQRSGTPEQYATLYALLARDLGVPARLVSGFRITTSDGGHQLSPGSHTVTSQDGYTWVEIAVRGSGWVVLDPSPSRYASADAQPSVGVSKSSTPSRSPSQAALVTESAGGHAVAPRSVVGLRRTANRQQLWYLIPGVLLAAGLLLVLLVLARKRGRLLRRRRVRDARLRVITAWQETLDLLAECGLGGLRTLTGAEVGDAVDERFGTVPAGHVRSVAAAADEAAFSEQAVIVARDAEEAWQAHRAVRRSVRRSLPPAQRLLSHLRVQPVATARTGPGRRRRGTMGGRRRAGARKH